MKFARFRITTLLISTAVVAVTLRPLGDYMGWFRPTKQVRTMIAFIESQPDSVSYKELRAEMALPNSTSDLAINAPDPTTVYGGQWTLRHGYIVKASFTNDDILSDIVIYDESYEFAWGWARGERNQEYKKWVERFFKRRTKH